MALQPVRTAVPPKLPAEIAREVFKDFDWAAYDAARLREFAAVKGKLGANRNYRRLTDTEPEKPKDTRSFEEKMSDKAIVATGDNLINLAERRTKDEYLRAVQVAYTAGREQLTPVQQNAVALVAWSMGLDPSPAMGHVYAWNDFQGFHIYIGYQAWIFKARAIGRQFVYTTRVMTPEEQIGHGIKNGDIGAICELYDAENAAMWKGMGLPPKPIVGVGVWQKNIPTKSGGTKQDNVPNGRTPLWVAEKRAITDALKHLGLGFGQMTIQPIDGMQWDNAQGQYVAGAGELAKPPEGMVLDGEYTAEGGEGFANEPPAEQPETSPRQPAEPNGTPRPYPPDMLQTKFEETLALIAKKQGARAHDVLSVTQIDALQGAFSDLCDPENATRFVLALTGREKLTNLEACEMGTLHKMLEDQDAARKEITDYLAWIDAQTPAEPVH